MTTVSLVHAAATLFMTGLVWFVQVVHYPLFRAVPDDAFATYHRGHTARTGRVVGPVMLVEAATSAWIALSSSSALAWTGVLLLAVVWLTTAFVQVPQHGRLSKNKESSIVTRLVDGNWIRTIAWTARSVVALALLA